MSHNDVNDVITENPNTAYEHKDVNVKSIAWFGVGLLTLTIVAMVLVWGLLTSLNNSRTDATSPSALMVPPEPRLQPNPVDQSISQAEHLQRETARQEKLLNSYGWVDKETGMVHMPIDEAMKLTVEEYQ
jgi:hypothetical protein